MLMLPLIVVVCLVVMSIIAATGLKNTRAAMVWALWAIIVIELFSVHAPNF